MLDSGQQVAIENLVQGDVVRCGQEAHETAKVAEVITGFASRWINLEFDDDSILPLSVTAEHPIWIDGTGWTPALAVQVGDYIFTSEGKRVEVLSSTLIKENRPLVTVRLEGDLALYANGILVHDQCGWWAPPIESTSQEEVEP